MDGIGGDRQDGSNTCRYFMNYWLLLDVTFLIARDTESGLPRTGSLFGKEKKAFLVRTISMGQGCCGGKPMVERTWNVERKYIEFGTPRELKLIDLIREQNAEPFDIEEKGDREMLNRLWKIAFPTEELPDLNQREDKWKYVGYQNARPETDFRAAGRTGLKQQLKFAEAFPDMFRRILAEGKYPWAAASINITEILVTHLKLRVPQPRIGPIPIRNIYNLQAFASLTTSASKGKDIKNGQFFMTAFNELHILSTLLLDAVWNKRLADDRSTNLLHFNFALEDVSKIIAKVIDEHPAHIQSLRAEFMSRLPPAYEKLVNSRFQAADEIDGRVEYLPPEM
ncbi:hypothetical protein AAMO2058_001192500 [Amorphochlora amoebiformis]